MHSILFYFIEKSSQPLITAVAGKKRKATEEVDRQGFGKRAALGEITNKASSAAANNSNTLTKGNLIFSFDGKRIAIFMKAELNNSDILTNCY